MRFVLRVLLAVVLSQLSVPLAMKLWAWSALALAKATSVHQIALDTLALAVPLAARSVGQAASLLSLPPLILACIGASYPASRRCLAAAAGLILGLLAVAVWQTLVTLISGYVFALRHAVTQPVALTDGLIVMLVCVAEAWITLTFIPVEGRWRDWLRSAPRRLS